jgi:hypothetical protein
MLFVSQLDNGPYVVTNTAESHTFTDPAAMRAFVASYQALTTTFPLSTFTLNDDGSIATWNGPDAQPVSVLAVVTAWQAAQAQGTTDAAALRARVVSLAQSAVGVQVDQLTAVQIRALVALLLYKQGAIDKTGAVLPLAGWL